MSTSITFIRCSFNSSDLSLLVFPQVIHLHSNLTAHRLVATATSLFRFSPFAKPCLKPCLPVWFWDILAQLGTSFIPVATPAQTTSPTQDCRTRTLKSSSLVWIMLERLSVASARVWLTRNLTFCLQTPCIRSRMRDWLLHSPHSTPVGAVSELPRNWPLATSSSLLMISEDTGRVRIFSTFLSF